MINDIYKANHPYNADAFLIRQLINEIHTSIPVKVVDVDTEAQTVTVVSMVKLIDRDGNAVEPAEIYNVPYIRIQGGENAIIIDPQVGDKGLAHFCMRDISAVKSTSADNIPGSFRTYNAADAIYTGGLLNKEPKRFVRITDAGVEIEGVDSVIIHGSDTTVNADTVNVNSQQMQVVSPVIQMTGNATLTGNLLINGGIAWTGTASPPSGSSTLRFGSNINVNGTVTATQLTANSVPYTTHRHRDSEGGTTGTPITGA